MSLFIPDISHHKTILSWNNLKNQSSFLLFKATEGTHFVDPKLREFIQRCEKYQIPYWTYSFLKKGNELEQAKFLVNNCKNIIGKYFIGYVLDIERQSKEKDVIEALEWLQKQGYKTMIYTQYYEYSLYKNLIKNRGQNCAWWQPRYGKDNGIYNKAYPCHDEVDLHQYTEKGRVNWSKQRVDLNKIVSRTKTLNWFTTKLNNNQKKEEKEKEKEKIKVNKKTIYDGVLPVLPTRGYYKKGDGISTLKKYPTQLKRMQQMLNWIDDSTKDIIVDGQFGQNTYNKVKVVQKILNVSVTGRFDQATLNAAKAFKK